MLAQKGEQGDIQASTELEKKVNPDTGETKLETVTKGGVTIDKDIAPKLQLDGPIGHYYTEILNKELSLESMGAVIAASADAISAEEASNQLETGKVSMTSQGPVNDSNTPEGYIYIIDGDTLESRALNELSSKFLDKRLKDPKAQLGIAMITKGKPSSTMESLTRCLSAADVRVTYFESGLIKMASDMLRKS